MKIAILSIWFSENMGYSENCLPKSLAKLGHEVHVISSSCQVYYNQPFYNTVYKDYLGEGIQKPGIKEVDGFTLHRLEFGTIFGKIYLKKLRKTLSAIKPDIVQTFDTFSFLTLQAGLQKFRFGYKFFTANHVLASVFPLMQDKKDSVTYKLFNFCARFVPGRLVSLITSRCYPATHDAFEIAVKYLGVPRKKAHLACLGVDTDMFKSKTLDPVNANIISEQRKELGLEDDSIVFIYTGRFTEAKNPLILAHAIDKLIKGGYNYRGLFLGEGHQGDIIGKMQGCVIKKFVPYPQLPKYYRLADVGVWPQQESTSMLDASACGLPIIISDRVHATERIEGNGLTYKQNDVDSLMEIMKTLSDKNLRLRLGIAGTKKIVENFSWDKIAKERAEDYRLFLNK